MICLRIKTGSERGRNQQFLALSFSAAIGKGSTLKILAETLQPEAVEYKLSLGAESQNGNPR